MHLALASAALLLMACTPAPPTAPRAAGPSAAPCAYDSAPAEAAACAANNDPAVPDPNPLSENPALTWSDVARDPLLVGSWHFSFSEDRAFITAAFGAEDAEPSFTFVCERRRRIVTLTRFVELAPNQATGIGFIIPEARYLFAAQSANEGVPSVSAEVSTSDPRLRAVARSQAGFAVQAGGDTSRIPNEEVMLNRVLVNCI